MSEALTRAMRMIAAGGTGVSAPRVAAKKCCGRALFPPPTARPAR